MEMHFLSYFFLNERNTKTSLLMIHLKCAAVHYLNSSSINKHYLRAAEYSILLSSLFFIYVYFRGLCQKLYEKTTIF